VDDSIRPASPRIGAAGRTGGVSALEGHPMIFVVVYLLLLAVGLAFNYGAHR
jgi:hypothetical protein